MEHLAHPLVEREALPGVDLEGPEEHREAVADRLGDRHFLRSELRRGRHGLPIAIAVALVAAVALHAEHPLPAAFSFFRLICQ